MNKSELIQAIDRVLKRAGDIKDEEQFDSDGNYIGLYNPIDDNPIHILELLKEELERENIKQQ